MQERGKKEQRRQCQWDLIFSIRRTFIDFRQKDMTKGSTYLLDGSWTYTSVPHPGGWLGWKSSGPRSTGTSAGGSPGRSTGGQRKPQSQKLLVMHQTLCHEAYFRVALTAQSIGIVVFLNQGSTLTCFGVWFIDNYQKFGNLCHLSWQGQHRLQCNPSGELWLMWRPQQVLVFYTDSLRLLFEVSDNILEKIVT